MERDDEDCKFCRDGRRSVHTTSLTTPPQMGVRTRNLGPSMASSVKTSEQSGVFLRFLTAATAFLFVGAALIGCASGDEGADETDVVASAQPKASATAEPAGATTIEEVFSKIGCKTNDPLGSRGMAQEHTFGPELERTGMCRPIEDGEVVFFYEASSEEAMDRYIASGKLESAPTDAIYRDGAILILARDAASAAMLGGQFESVDYTPAL